VTQSDLLLLLLPPLLVSLGMSALMSIQVELRCHAYFHDTTLFFTSC
jgi:hypothetical protein